MPWRWAYRDQKKRWVLYGELTVFGFLYLYHISKPFALAVRHPFAPAPGLPLDPPRVACLRLVNRPGVSFRQ